MTRTTTVTPLRTLPLPGTYPCGLTWDGVHLWHSDQVTKSIYAIDPTTGVVLRALACPVVRADLTFDGQWLCQVGMRPKRFVLVDRATGRRVGHRAVPPASGRLTGAEHGRDGVWLCLRGPTVLQLRDHPDMTVLREFPVAGDAPSGLTVAGDVVLHGDFLEQRIRATDPVTGTEVGAVAVPGSPTGLAWDGRYVWYCDFQARRLGALRLADLLGHH